MKKILFTLVCALLLVGNAGAQTAKQVLDKTAATISSKSGIKANFTISGNKYGNVSGTIAVKGRKFQATTPMAVMWFDGKTQWTYMKKNDEVNVSNPTEAQLQAINPYNFINHFWTITATYASTTCYRIRTCHIRICSIIYIKHNSLCSFK